MKNANRKTNSKHNYEKTQYFTKTLKQKKATSEKLRKHIGRQISQKKNEKMQNARL